MSTSSFQSLWCPPPLSQPDTHSEMTEHTKRKHLAPSGGTAAPAEMGSRVVCRGSILDHPPQALASLQPMEVVQWLLKCTHTAPSSSGLEHSFPIAGHSWLMAHSPAPLWEPSLKRAASSTVIPLTFPGQRRTSYWPHRFHWGQFCAATPTPELPHGADWPFIVTGISRGSLPQAEREASLCPVLLSSLPDPKSFSYKASPTPESMWLQCLLSGNLTQDRWLVDRVTSCWGLGHCEHT